MNWQFSLICYVVSGILLAPHYRSFPEEGRVLFWLLYPWAAPFGMCWPAVQSLIVGVLGIVFSLLVAALGITLVAIPIYYGVEHVKELPESANAFEGIEAFFMGVGHGILVNLIVVFVAVLALGAAAKVLEIVLGLLGIEFNEVKTRTPPWLDS